MDYTASWRYTAEPILQSYPQNLPLHPSPPLSHFLLITLHPLTYLLFAYYCVHLSSTSFFPFLYLPNQTCVLFRGIKKGSYGTLTPLCKYGLCRGKLVKSPISLSSFSPIKNSFFVSIRFQRYKYLKNENFRNVLLKHI